MNYNNIKSLPVFILVLTFHFSVNAQYLKGFVYDDISEKPLQEAKVLLKSGKKIENETTTAFNGSFLLNLKKGKSYTLTVQKHGYDDYSTGVEAASESLPAMEIFMIPVKPELIGVLENDKGEKLTHVEIQLIDLRDNHSEFILTDEDGEFRFELNPNTSYRFIYEDPENIYSDASLFVSTVGATGGLQLRKKMVVSANDTKNIEEDEWALVNLKKEELEMYSNEINIDESKYNDSVYVVNKRKPIISFNKRKQKEREKKIETIYFYAQLPADSEFPVDKEIRIIEEKEKPVREEMKEEKETTKDVTAFKNVRKIEKPLKQETKTQEEETEVKPQEDEKITMDEAEKTVTFGEQGESISIEKNITSETPVPAKNTVYFAKGKSWLTSEARQYLDRFAEILEENPKVKLTLTAHTDSDMEYTIAQHLSRLRAESVMNYLLENGAVFDQLDIKAVGNSNPANECSKDVECTEEEHKMNRRVELLFQQNKPY